MDDARIAGDAAPHSHRQHLALLKHAPELPHAPDDGWPRLVCANDRYLEAIFVGDLVPEVLECVRMQRTDHDLYFELLANDFRTRLPAADRMVVDLFRMIRKVLKARRIRLEVCDDA